MSIPAVFVDQDGTLLEDVPYHVDPDHIRLLPGAAAGLRLLYAAGYRLVVISNQAGVARGRFAEGARAAVWQRLRELLADVGVPLVGFYYCPHYPEGSSSAYAQTCSGRKPQPGLLQRAAEEHGLDLTQSWVIGDLLDDMEAGRRAGCRSVLINRGHETEWVLSPARQPHFVASDLDAAARLIVSARRRLPRRLLKRQKGERGALAP
ncbi:MAG: HAD family hydrolase [Gemmataceae bacterium]|nr:HAD family hydrolase [Gemmataceae bacterium]